MDKLRISEKNRINTRIRELESFTRFNSNSISRLRGSNGNIEFNRAKIAKMKTENATIMETGFLPWLNFLLLQPGHFRYLTCTTQAPVSIHP